MPPEEQQGSHDPGGRARVTITPSPGSHRKSPGQHGRGEASSLAGIAGLRRFVARLVSGAGVRGRRRQRSLIAELPILVVAALAAALLLKTFVVQAFFIPSGSMQDTLQIGDKILVNKLVYDFRSIQPGDIVVFDGTGTWNVNQPVAKTGPSFLGRLYDDTVRPVLSNLAALFGTPADQVDYVKRVIGVPGDHVVCCNAQGLVTVNGVALREQSYLYPGNRPSDSPLGIPGRFNVTVPQGYLWVLGDHRSVSDDSRGHEAFPMGGLIPENHVIGRAFVIVWPPSHWRILPIPATFSQPGIAAPAGGAAAGTGGSREGALASGVMSAALRPEPSYLPLTGGLAVALPLTWLVRRRRHSRWRRARDAGQPE